MENTQIGTCIQCGCPLYKETKTSACRDWCNDCEDDYIAEGDPNF